MTSSPSSASMTCATELPDKEFVAKRESPIIKIREFGEWETISVHATSAMNKPRKTNLEEFTAMAPALFLALSVFPTMYF